mmetsp:Transcript_32911/g.83361  ORF Transcript_32911/g.83361 Transcript_32911/m.83361 type:complete len:504 (-) Transcript_32911:119-1630(-)
MANLLDTAINQHLLNLKANSSMLVGRPTGPPMPPTGGVPPGAMMPFTAPGPFGGPMLQGGQPPPPPGVPGAAPGLPPPGLPGPGPMSAPGPPGGLPLPPPPGSGGLVSVAIDNLPFRYQLSETDLRETFQRWGSLQSVQVSRDGGREVGVVAFEDPIDASDARRQLHGHVCGFDGASGVLNVIQGGPEQLGGRPLGPPPGPFPQAMTGPPPSAMAMLPPPTTGAPPPVGGPPPAVAATTGPPPQAGAPPLGGPPAMQMGGPQQAGPPPLGQVPPAGSVPGPSGACLLGAAPEGAMPKSSPVPMMPGVNGRPAWCCKIIIQAESLHSEFPTAAKIVGNNEANIEHLRSQTHCSAQLRGRGSGFLEPDGRELQENMFLWLSSNDPQHGKAGLEMAQDLLKSVYEEHQAWCTQHKVFASLVTEPVVIENPDLPMSMPAPGPVPATGPPAPGPPGAAPGGPLGMAPAPAPMPTLAPTGPAPALQGYGPCPGGAPPMHTGGPYQQQGR